MVEPIVVPRSEHTISRRDIDPDALKVLYRLRDASYVAYLVGGSVRDLLLGRRPKDFDIGTTAHPYEIKRLFRNCWIIGRRFRLAHVRFGTKVIEVATFRRNVPPAGADTSITDDGEAGEPPPAAAPAAGRRDLLIERDNTYGTPEEDAFRRDFTINALFYDIATFSIIDYVGGLRDLKARVVRSIGNPDERFQEDPVRMLRAIALGARLGFDLDPPVAAAIARQRHDIARSAPARLLEEYFKILRAGAAELTFRMLLEHRLLDRITPEVSELASPELWRALRALDSYRRRAQPDRAVPDGHGRPGGGEGLSNALLLGTLLVPLQLVPGPGRFPATDDLRRELRGGSLGLLPVPRKDLDRLRQILALQRRLFEVDRSPRVKRTLLERPAFVEALTWLDVHGESPEIVAHWRALVAEQAPPADELRPFRGYRRRRRRRRPAAKP